MEQIEHKTFLGDKEVTLIAERYSTKFYQCDDIIYITYYDEIVAEVNKDAIKFDEELEVTLI